MTEKLLQRDCIAAVATPPGRGGIGIIRISGAGSRRLAWPFFRPADPALRWEELPSHRAIFGHIIDPESGETLDQGLFLYLRQGQSYTGEETVELQGHGSPLLLEQLISRLLSRGARLAQPGEFTRRAFLNGRIDLAMAQGVLELIEAQNSLALRQGQKKLRGELTEKITAVWGELVEIRALVEASLDFSDEDLPVPPLKEIEQRLRQLRTTLQNLENGYKAGQSIREGFGVVLAGPPNVGKSSLFNALLGEERAIVHSHPGTTRDYIEEKVEWEGIPIRLIDIAGIYDKTVDSIEKVGIKIGITQIQKADIVIFVRDVNSNQHIDIKNIIKDNRDINIIKVGNKIDLRDDSICENREDNDELFTSAETKRGIFELKMAIIDNINNKYRNNCQKDFYGGIDNIFSVSLWQKNKISNTIKYIDNIMAMISKWETTSDLIAEELRSGSDCIGEIINKSRSSDEVLDIMFSKFCIGK